MRNHDNTTVEHTDVQEPVCDDVLELGELRDTKGAPGTFGDFVGGLYLPV